MDRISEKIKELKKQYDLCKEIDMASISHEIEMLEKERSKYISFTVACDGIPPYYEGDEVSNCSTHKMGVCKIKYDNDEDVLHVWLKRPGLLIGRAGSNIKNVEEYIECKIQIHEVKNLWEWD